MRAPLCPAPGGLHTSDSTPTWAQTRLLTLLGLGCSLNTATLISAWLAPTGLQAPSGRVTPQPPLTSLLVEGRPVPTAAGINPYGLLSAGQPPADQELGVSQW